MSSVCLGEYLILLWNKWNIVNVQNKQKVALIHKFNNFIIYMGKRINIRNVPNMVSYYHNIIPLKNYI